mmetsp:Transcript_33283/g.48934  ORF Transcript_33283/g.48934 Transcript_33283/m.48934 type:complete len:385 (+) Transcript_33283:94-1248(+)|eukprot:CAMPEP_0195509566 /NCGR_PEP_ID=MMETSP0794_2-20130614/2468_1 /TAXON_ID=515487 /ORGANISM="Stephanopyxis turris, Strain CCMP 815" /LENGTH=384 /DNA_ID=CAMNT_0040636821 /DNA_START=94 /DNA_END=1251 /DNA_ORIENTATION=+
MKKSGSRSRMKEIGTIATEAIEKKAIKKKVFSETTLFKFILLSLMVMQNTSFAMLGSYTRSNIPEEELYVVSHAILLQECVKFCASFILEAKHVPTSLKQSLMEHVFQNPLDALKISIPALLYLIQTSLLFVALSNLPAPLYQVAFQGKLLTTALVSVIMLRRRYNTRQWICLLSLGLGVAVVVLGKDLENEVAFKDTASMFVGLIAVAAACFCSALAGVYTEKLLKAPVVNIGKDKRAPASLWMRNIQMSFFSICIAIAQIATLKGPDAEKPLMHGFTNWVYVLVLVQAAGGLLVAAVMKFTDNVLKGLAMGVSVILTTTLSMLFFGVPLTSNFVSGATIVLGSVYFFSNDCPVFLFKCGASGKTEKVEMHELVEKKDEESQI